MANNDIPSGRIRRCSNCGLDFDVGKYAQRRYCSDDCLDMSRQKRLIKDSPTRTEICRYCILPFTRNSPSKRSLFCSDACREQSRLDSQSRYRDKKASHRHDMECVICGDPLHGMRLGAKFCSKSCKYKDDARKRVEKGIQNLFDKSAARVCEVCGCDFYPNSPIQKRCSAECSKRHRRDTRISHAFQCLNCGSDFHPKASNRTKFCSRECAFEKQKADAFLRAPDLEEARLAKLAAKRERSKAERLQRKNNPTYELRCEDCGEEFLWRGPNKKFCSVSCQARNRNRKSKNADPRPCKECGKNFTPEYGNKRRDFCSKGCLRKHSIRTGRTNRRAREKEQFVESVDPFSVFERDKWRCHLCGVSTPKRLRGTLDDRAPELDHIVPLAAGGAHSYANTACACRACNIKKGATPKGQPSFDFAA